MATPLPRPLRLLPESALRRTGPVDHPDWNYRPVIGRVQRLRFRIALGLLAGRHVDRLLEIGYGSGVFLPELAEHCDVLYGADPHPYPGQVTASLAAHRVDAVLSSAGAEALPYPTGFFPCVVAVSVLEVVPDIEAACREIRRVLAPGGSLVVVTPGDTPLWDLALRIATREDPALYGDRRQRLQPALRRHFRVTRETRVPRFGGRALRLYTGLHLQNP